MNLKSFVFSYALFGVGMALIGYGIGCLKTRAEFMEAVARSMADHYSNTASQ